MKQILTGINYLHNEIGIIHRDLKLNNLLLKYQNDFDLKNLNEAEVKIIDFNLSYIGNEYGPKSVVGALSIMAPTIIYNIENPTKYYDENVDIWSLETLCYEILFGKPLFPNMKTAK